MKKSLSRLVFAVVSACLGSGAMATGTWSSISTPIPSGCTPASMYQLTDGSILVGSDLDANNAKRWFKFKPNSFGWYTVGTWTEVTPSPNGRLWFASGVLPDGRIPMFGGEYLASGGTFNKVWTTNCDIYDPVANTWTSIVPPAGWTKVGDAVSTVLADGRFMMSWGTKSAIFNADTNTFSAGPVPLNGTNEEGWIQLWNNNLISPDAVTNTGSERFDFTDNAWTWDSNIPVLLFTGTSNEPGSGVTLPNGKVFHTGGPGTTAIYTSGRIDGTWVAGPSFPKIGGIQQGAEDAMTVLMYNGKVLCSANQASTFTGPTHLYEYNYLNGSLVQVPDPVGGLPESCYRVHFLQLPNGQIAVSHNDNEILLYNPDGAVDSGMRPSEIYAPPRCRAGDDLIIAGKQINGVTQGAQYGDEGNFNTNFPLVRFVDNSGHKYYSRTHDHSSMAIGPNHSIQNTNAKVPSNLPDGQYDVEVVANGIPDSTGRSISVNSTYNLIQGKVTLGDWTDRTEEQGYLFDVDLVDAATNNVVASQVLRTKEDGSYQYFTSFEGIYYLRFKTWHWLSKKTINAQLLGGTTVTRTVSNMVNGDIDGDNVVSIIDYSIFSDYYDRTEFQAGWSTVGSNGFRPIDADLDGDGEVSILDYSVFSDNYDKVGT